MKALRVQRTMALIASFVVLILAFQNCSSDFGPAARRPNPNDQQSSGTPNPTPTPSPTPTPGPIVQPTPNTAITDVKSPSGTSCLASYGLYDLLQTTPAIANNWNHNVCLLSFENGDATVISDVLLSPTICVAPWETALSIDGGGPDFTVTKFNQDYWLCIRRRSVPVNGSFVTYFYLSGPDANCLNNDVTNGSAVFCSQANSNGTCMGQVTVKLCKAGQN